MNTSLETYLQNFLKSLYFRVMSSMPFPKADTSL